MGEKEEGSESKAARANRIITNNAADGRMEKPIFGKLEY